MKDMQGREYAKMSKLKDGDIVEVDDGFTCMKGHRTICVEEDGMYVYCDCGRHYMSGQLDDQDGDSLIGIYPVQS